MMNIKLNKYLTRACIRNLNLWVQICYTNDLKMGAGGGHRGKYGCPSGNYRELSHICYSDDLKMGGGTEVSMAALVGIIRS